MTAPLLDISGLSVVYRNGRTAKTAVSGVSLDVRAGETVGLVGESGSGKSTVGRVVLGLVTPAAGTVSFNGQDITTAGRAQRRKLAGHIQAIFQDPYSSLNPTRTIGATLAEPLQIAAPGRSGDHRARVVAMLERVGLPGDAVNRYPAAFSGGQRQRIAIARALVLRPALVICDEPVSALDLSVQAQVLNLLADMQHELSLSYLFISHDLAVVRHIAHRILVMRQAEIVEQGPADRVYRDPQHPYTRSLLAAAPVADPAVQRGRSLAVTKEDMHRLQFVAG